MKVQDELKVYREDLDISNGKKEVTKKKPYTSEIFEYFKIILFSLLSVYLITNFLIKPIRVDGESMYPTLHDSEAGFASVLNLNLEPIERFDIVIAKESHSNAFWVKRVIGLPGETVKYEDDVLYIDGKAIEEPFLANEHAEEYQEFGLFTQDFGPIKLGDDDLFLMGDNRPYSTDSRYRGPFNLDDIVAKDIVIVLPFTKLRDTNINR